MEELENKVKQAIEEGSLEETLEKIVDRKVEEKLQEQKESLGNEESSQEEQEISRRSFLKKAGLGAIGLGAMSMLPSASALQIKDSDGFQAYSGGTEYFDVNPGGPVEVLNTNLQISNTRNIDFSYGGERKFRLLHDAANTRLRMWDQINSQPLLDWNKGGPVKVSNAQLSLGSGLQMNGNKIFSPLSIDSRSGSASQLQIVGAGASWKVRDYENGQDLMQWHEGGPVEIENTNLQFNGNSIEGINALYGDSGSGSLLHTNGTLWKVWDTTNSQNLMIWNEGGPIEVLNVDLSIGEGQLIEFAGAGNTVINPTVNGLNLHTSGSGSGYHRIYDDANSQDLMRFNEGGPVEAKNADFHAGQVVRSSDGSSTPGSDTRPSIQVGSGGAGFYVDSNGNLMAVDNNGNTTTVV